MTAIRRINAIAVYTLRGLLRRWVVLLPFGLTILLLLSQAPRFGNLYNLFEDPAHRANALGAFAQFLESMINSLTVIGAILAMSLGSWVTGSRSAHHALVPLLARPVARLEVLSGRAIANLLILIAFWAFPMLLFEGIRLVVHAPVMLSPFALVLPLLLNIMMLSFAMALGAYLTPVAATLMGLVVSMLLLMAQSGLNATNTWRVALAEAALWTMPPMLRLLDGVAPFASFDSVFRLGPLVIQSAAWIGILFLLAGRRFDRLDFTSRR